MLKLPQTQGGGFVQQIVEVRILHRIDIASFEMIVIEGARTANHKLQIVNQDVLSRTDCIKLCKFTSKAKNSNPVHCSKEYWIKKRVQQESPLCRPQNTAEKRT